MKTLLLSIILLSAVNSYSQDVTIPDSNFKNYLVADNAINTNADNEIQVAEANAYTGLINCPGLGISDLTGIEAFTALTVLYCYDNQLTSLDVSSNTALTDLYCFVNQLTSLDVSSNTALTDLYCFANQLTSLNVSGATALTNLVCYDNQLTSLDVSSNTALTDLECDDNQLTSLDVSSNTALTDLYCFDNQLQCLNANNGQNFISFFCNPNQLSCVSVSDVTYAYNNYSADPSITFQFQCENPIDNDVNQIGSQLTAVENGVSYQWLDCDNNYAVINGETNQTYTPTTTGYFAVELTPIGGCGGVQVDTSTCNLVDFTGIGELNNTSKQLIKIVDLMGRETTFKPSTPLIYIYSDGTVERVFKLEQ